MKLNRNELKKIQYDFNSVSNRLMRADIDDYHSVLKRFIDFIESKEIIMDYISGCGESVENWAEEVSEVQKNYGVYFLLGDTDDEETRNVFALLKYVVENRVDVPRSLATGYSSSNKYVDKLKGFNERVCYVLIQHIEGYLTKIGIDMGMDENRFFNITNNNGQVNIATDNASVKAEYTSGIDVSELTTLIEAIRNNSASLSEDDKTAVQGSLDIVSQELQSPSPRKNVLNLAISALKGIKGTAEFGAAIATLITFVQPML